MTRVWRPLSGCNNDGIMLDRAEDVYVYDVFSKRYFDANSGLWNVNLGYSNKIIKKAVADQLEKLPFANPLLFYPEAAARLSEKLCLMLAEDITKVFFTCTGSEAIEVAIKLIRKYLSIKKKPQKKIAVFGNSYHGSYYGSMSASFFEGENRGGYTPLLDGFISLGIPYIRASGSISNSDAQNQLLIQLNRWLEKFGEDICAIIIEPVIGSGGVIAPDKAYMNRLMEYCRGNDILVVCDEIACGFFRCGKLFGFQYYEIHPDIVTLSKGLNNGYLPLGAVCIGERIAEAFSNRDAFLFHLSTQNLNPLAIAAAEATISQYNDALHEKVNKASEFWTLRLNALLQLNCVFSIRAYGLMFAVDFQDKDGNPLSLNRLISLIERIIDNGVLVGDSYIESVQSSIVMFPPYIASRQDIRRTVSVINKAIIELIEW